MKKKFIKIYKNPKTYNLYILSMSDPFSLNGGSMVAMRGEKCVAIGADRRLGS